MEKSSISHIYKSNSPNALNVQKPRHKQSLEKKYKARSFIKEKIYSNHRAITPIEPVAHFQKRIVPDTQEKSAIIDSKQLEAVLSGLPKIHQTLKAADRERKKRLEHSYDNSNINNINKIYSTNASYRSKSTIYRKKATLPKIAKGSPEINDLKQYLNDFQEKSKLLLRQLEEKVFGSKPEYNLIE